MNCYHYTCKKSNPGDKNSDSNHYQQRQTALSLKTHKIKEKILQYLDHFSYILLHLKSELRMGQPECSNSEPRYQGQQQQDGHQGGQEHQHHGALGDVDGGGHVDGGDVADGEGHHTEGQQGHDQTHDQEPHGHQGMTGTAINIDQANCYT